MDNIPLPPLGELISEYEYHERSQRCWMAQIYFTDSSTVGWVQTEYIDISNIGRKQVYIFQFGTTIFAVDRYVKCLWNVGHTALHDTPHTALHDTPHTAPHTAPHDTPHTAPHTAPHDTPHTWNHLLNMDKGDDQRKAVENHVKSMIDSCPPGFFKETVFEASCKEWMSHL
jgi:hypothetical protein